MTKYVQERKMPLVHKLQFPLLLSGPDQDNRQYLLPKGTSLYYDQAFPEGFVRFKIYVNVEGVKLESYETNEKFWLEPLTAIPVDSPNLKKLLREYPLSKDDLSEILKSSAMSKEEIKDVLTDFLR